MDVLYSGLVSVGTCLPLILITTDPQVPADIEGDSDAYVYFMPDVKKPSSETSLTAFQHWRDYFSEGDHVILDRGTEFQNRIIDQELDDMGVISHVLPTGGGAFADPNDNSFFSAMEGFYKRQPKQTHADAIRAIIRAYYHSTEQQIRNHFRNCLITANTPTRKQVRHLIEKSWRDAGARRREYQSYRQEFRRFESNSRLLSADVRRLEPPCQIEEGALDGAQWMSYYY